MPYTIGREHEHDPDEDEHDGRDTVDHQGPKRIAMGRPQKYEGRDYRGHNHEVREYNQLEGVNTQISTTSYYVVAG
jgi:hypothetical protein